MAYEEPDLPVAGNPVSTSSFGFKVRNSVIWLKEQVDTLLTGNIPIAGHQGGSATALSTPGTTNYTPTGLVMITGVAYFAIGDNDVTVTYPFTWAEKPFVFCCTGYPHGLGSFSGRAQADIINSLNQSVTSFAINIAVVDRAVVWAIPWFAIGVPA